MIKYGTKTVRLTKNIYFLTLMNKERKYLVTKGKSPFEGSWPSKAQKNVTKKGPSQVYIYLDLFILHD